jgi:hypothetical protein
VEGVAKRTVEYIVSDPFVDAAFVSYLVSNQEWLEVLTTQAKIYSEIGDLGEHLSTFYVYKEKAKSYIIDRFKGVYNEKLLEKEIKRIGDEKAKRAWRAVMTLLVSQQLMKKARTGLGELLPEEYNKLEYIVPVLYDLIEEKIKQKGRGAHNAVREIFKKYGKERSLNLAPLLWWINLIMESEAFEGVLKYHFLVSKGLVPMNVIERLEEELSNIEGHKKDLEYMRQEFLKALLSRCAELRGQYINKLQSAILFVKLWRVSVKNPEAWEWFLKKEILTYTLPIYLSELQSLIGLAKIKLNISSLILPKSGVYSGLASTLSTLILMSPLFMQYIIEAQHVIKSGGEASIMPITPADIIVAIARAVKSHGETGSFIIDVHDLIEDIVKFWSEKGILQRLEDHLKSKITPETLITRGTFVTSLALIINTGIWGVYTITYKRPEFRLPPRMDGFDSIYVRAEEFLPILKSVWG